MSTNHAFYNLSAIGSTALNNLSVSGSTTLGSVACGDIASTGAINAASINGIPAASLTYLSSLPNLQYVGPLLTNTQNITSSAMNSTNIAGDLVVGTLNGADLSNIGRLQFLDVETSLSVSVGTLQAKTINIISAVPNNTVIDGTINGADIGHLDKLIYLDGISANVNDRLNTLQWITQNIIYGGTAGGVTYIYGDVTINGNLHSTNLTTVSTNIANITSTGSNQTSIAGNLTVGTINSVSLSNLANLRYLDVSSSISTSLSSLSSSLSSLSSTVSTLSGSVTTLSSSVTANTSAVQNISATSTVTSINGTINNGSTANTNLNTCLGGTFNPVTISSQNNTAIGYNSLFNILTSNLGNNTAVGSRSGQNITSGVSNTYVGVSAGLSNATGGNNVSVGAFTQNNVSSTNYATMVGTNAGRYAAGNYNTMIGYSSGQGSSGYSVTNCSSLGANSVFPTGVTQSTAIGYGATITTSNQIMMGTSTETVTIAGNLQIAGRSKPDYDSGFFSVTANMLISFTTTAVYNNTSGTYNVTTIAGVPALPILLLPNAGSAGYANITGGFYPPKIRVFFKPNQCLVNNVLTTNTTDYPFWEINPMPDVWNNGISMICSDAVTLTLSLGPTIAFIQQNTTCASNPNTGQNYQTSGGVGVTSGKLRVFLFR